MIDHFTFKNVFITISPNLTNNCNPNTSSNIIDINGYINKFEMLESVKKDHDDLLTPTLTKHNIGSKRAKHFCKQKTNAL